MTAVGGLLLLLDERPAPRLDGLSLPPLVATGSASDIESIFGTRAPLNRSRWTGIVIHHSGATAGSPASIAAEHEALNFRGLGHQFLIGNGNGMEDGQLYVGFRWMDQLPGAHAGGPQGDAHNLHSISICLVGNGDRRPFTAAQYRRLVELVTALCRELDIPAEAVRLHSEIAPTTDPGQLFHAAEFRRDLRRDL
jgi:hypothetical protein